MNNCMTVITNMATREMMKNAVYEVSLGIDIHLVNTRLFIRTI